MSRLARAALVVLPVLGVGYAVLGSGLDRMSEADPGFSGMVPQTFRAAAWRSGGALDIAGGRLTAARDKAARAILADPMDAASSSALGLARLKLHDGVAAEAAFRVAGQLGWRDKTTQLYWMALSIDSGAFPLAAQRADALLRQDSRLREQPRLLAVLEASAAGRKALAARIALRPAWFGDYWNKLYLLDADQLANRARVLDEGLLRPPAMMCADVQTMTTALAEKQYLAQNRTIRSRFCYGPRNASLHDGGFEAAQLANTSEIGWQFVGDGGLDVRIEGTGSTSGRAVVVTSSLPFRQVFARQALELEPGRYRVGWRVHGGTKDAPSSIAVRLTCQQNASEYLVPKSAGGGRELAVMVVPARCPNQWLDLAVDPGAGRVAVDDITIERIV